MFLLLRYICALRQKSSPVSVALALQLNLNLKKYKYDYCLHANCQINFIEFKVQLMILHNTIREE